MYGAILGDIIGSPYEFDQGDKTKEFPLFCKRNHYTDDSVMTVAVAEALMNSKGKDEAAHKKALVDSMQKWGLMIPDAGYGFMFYNWLHAENPQPYGSYGNGSAMRVSTAGWLYETLEETREKARWTAEVTHNHPEGIKGAEAVASSIYLARTWHTKEEIREYIISEFGYDLSRTCDEIRPGYHHVETCQETVPEAITAFLEGEGFEEVIRIAVSMGGDCDTLTCIAGSIAEAFYGVPEELKEECRKRIEPEMLEVMEQFVKMPIVSEERTVPNVLIKEELLADGTILKKAAMICSRNRTMLNFVNLFRILRDSWVWVPCMNVLGEEDRKAWNKTIQKAVENDDLDSLVGQELVNHDAIRLIPDILKDGDVFFFPVFTSTEEMGEYGDHLSKVQKHFLEVINVARNNDKDVKGIVINAFTGPFVIPKEAFGFIERLVSAVDNHH